MPFYDIACSSRAAFEYPGSTSRKVSLVQARIWIPSSLKLVSPWPHFAFFTLCNHLSMVHHYSKVVPCFLYLGSRKSAFYIEMKMPLFSLKLKQRTQWTTVLRISRLNNNTNLACLSSLAGRSLSISPDSYSHQWLPKNRANNIPLKLPANNKF